MTEQYWQILEEITKKSDWYTKVFNDEIVNKWCEEVLAQGNLSQNTLDNFWLSIRILRATAQGTFHDPKCVWDDSCNFCDECFDKIIDKLKKKGYFEKIDVDLDDEDDVEECAYDYCVNKGFRRCEHMLCTCQSPNSELDDYVRYIRRGLIDNNTRNMLKKMVQVMREKDTIDWHPWSDNKVRDIIHPSLYCYVKGKSVHTDGSISEEVDETNRYQWLPSEIDVSEIGKVTFKSYINNLHRDEYIPLFENTLSRFIPEFEKVLHRSLRETTCQVIVKVGSTHLSPDKPSFDGGSWHIEGMPCEHIVATGIHYLEVENITPSFLEFRKPVVINELEVDYPQCDDAYTATHYGVTDHYDGKMNRYLGLIKSEEGASVVFPNSLQHRIKEFALEEKSKEGVRTIVAFFLIDPDQRIVSTTDVPKQYGNMSLAEAKEYREKLMYQRKYFVDELNKQVYEREFSLCEH